MRNAARRLQRAAFLCRIVRMDANRALASHHELSSRRREKPSLFHAFSSERNKEDGAADELERSSSVFAQGAPVESAVMRFAVCVPFFCCITFPFRS